MARPAPEPPRAVSRLVAVCATLVLACAGLSLLLDYMPVYDPWGWLVWGRELGRLELATAAGPSWKPLPVFVDAPLSLLGGGAPKTWLLIARAGWLAAPLLAGALAAHLTGRSAGGWRWVAALLAAASVGLTGDSFTPPVRQFTGGLSEPLLVALVLGAIGLALGGRPRAALWLGALASLLRPECWPFLVLWAWREVKRDPRLRADAAVAAVLIPLAWFLPDLLGAGNPLEGSETARQGGIELMEVAEVLGRALTAPLAGVWIGVALFLSRRSSDRHSEAVLRILLAAAVGWVAVVAAMAVAGFAGLPRFLAPASAVFSIVGAVGVARTGAESHAARGRPLSRTVAVAAALIAAVAGFGLRAAAVPGDVDTIETQTRSQEQLFELAERIGSERLLACGGTVRVTQVLAQTALAWKLDQPIDAVRVRRHPLYGVALSVRPLPGTELGRVGAWRATQLPC